MLDFSTDFFLELCEILHERGIKSDSSSKIGGICTYTFIKTFTDEIISCTISVRESCQHCEGYTGALVTDYCNFKDKTKTKPVLGGIYQHNSAQELATNIELMMKKLILDFNNIEVHGFSKN